MPVFKIVGFIVEPAAENPIFGCFGCLFLLSIIIMAPIVCVLEITREPSNRNKIERKERHIVENRRTQQTKPTPNLSPFTTPTKNPVTAPDKNDGTNLYDWKGTVPATGSNGVQVEFSNGDKFTVSAGDELEIWASGIVQVRSDGKPSDANGEKGYRDPYVDSKFYDRVGGLEMWIGNDKEDNRYFVGTHFRQKVKHSGNVTLRVIDALAGYKGTGSFTVTVRKINSSNPLTNASQNNSLDANAKQRPSPNRLF